MSASSSSRQSKRKAHWGRRLRLFGRRVAPWLGGGAVVGLMVVAFPPVAARMPRALHLAAMMAAGALAGFAWWLREWSLAREASAHAGDRPRLVHAAPEGIATLSPAARHERQRTREALLRGRLQGIVSTLRHILSAHAAVLYVQNERGELELVCHSATDEALVVPVLDGKPGVVHWAFRHAEPFSAMELGRSVSGIEYYSMDQGIRSLVAVPVLRQEASVGVLAVDSREVQAFTGDEYVYVLESTAMQIANWLDRDAEQADAEEELAQWRAFFAAAQRLQAIDEVGSAVDYALELVDTVVDADLVVLCEAVPGQRSFVIRGAAGRTFGVESDTGFAADESWLGLSLERGFVQRIGDLSRRKAGLPLICRGDGIPDQGSVVAIPVDRRDGDATPGGGLLLWSHRADMFSAAETSMLEQLMAPFSLAWSRVRVTEQLRQMATRDALTGLNNRRVANEHFEAERRRALRTGKPLAAILFDVDHFKRVNDTWGHDVGDDVLRNVARVLRESVRETDLPARYGGEEFFVVLPETDIDGARRLAERIRKRLEKSRVPLKNGKFLQVTASFGVAVFDPSLNPEEGLTGVAKRADLALYAAKEGGRNQVRIADDADHPLAAL
ncbi:MAG: GGDEF domain-containing protein [Candidatus Dadabacteria bacterium]|nr:MAG: GGDEF domain-containing protein [Candidatus Dadabacteria bacterium]